jgi:putative ABC transport system permease protein
MKISTIAIKNIKRRKTKVALLVIGLMIAIASLTSIMTLMSSFRNKIDKQLGKYGFNILVFPKSSDLSLTYGGMNVSGVSSYKAAFLNSSEMKEIDRLKKDFKMYVSPKFLSGVEVKNTPALFVGIDPTEELSVKKWWKIKGAGFKDKSDSVFGSAAANKLKVKLGDKVSLNGKPFKVTGILKETGSQDDDLIFGNIAYAQKMFGMEGKVNLIEIATDNTEDIDPVVSRLSKAIPGASVSSVKQAVKYKENAMNKLSRFGLTVSGVIIFISAMIVFATMTSSVTERTREIGIFRAIGYRKSKITKIILIEAALLSFLGGLLGYFLGFGIAGLLAFFVKSIAVVVKPDLYLAALSVLVSLFVGLVSSMFPAYKAANLDPAIALKEL